MPSRRRSFHISVLLALAVGSAALASAVRADEGMWPLEAFPSDKVAQAHGFKPTQPWLEHVRLASARLAQGCSGSFVSQHGLVLTNHHCARSCVEQLSTAKRDFTAEGFFARTPKDELKCPEVEVNRLESIRDVTQAMLEATRGKAGEAFAAAKRAKQATLERECATSDDLRCDVVELYHGGQYHLYQYRRFQDVRLVFVPESDTAFFGGDPDNFNFPRYDLDMALLRIYDRGAPADVTHYFPFSEDGAKEGELTFVSGHPGRTSRELSISELAFMRDVQLPRTLLRLAELRGVITEFQRRGKEQKRTSEGTLFGIENSLKAYRGRYEALVDAAFMESKQRAEQDFRRKLGASKHADANKAWDAIDKALATYRNLYDAYDLLERGRGFSSELFGIARTLVRASEELPKANETRLREFGEAALPSLKQQLFSPAPIHTDLEVTQLAFSLGKLREILGADDPMVKTVLGKSSPEHLAAQLVKQTGLAKVALRKRLFEGGRAAIDASSDPMIALAKRVDAKARELRKRYENEVDSVLTKAHAELAKARFALYGASVYPDATFTLRLSFGEVAGWMERGAKVAPFTTFAGAFERNTGEAPFALPKSWLAARPKLNLETKLNFSTDNDIIGGNSGSPVINKDAQVVGLIFDGNIHSLGGDFGFEPRNNRAVAVHSSAILQALDRIYGASRVADELRSARTGGQ